MHFDAYSHFHTLPFVRNFYLFVDFFFVMSGFVIAANYEKRLLRGFGLGKFMVLRLGRLLPLHLFMLASFIGFALIRVGVPELSTIIGPRSEQSITAAVANIFLVHGLGLFDSLTWNRPSWSISTEFSAYIIFALMIVTLRKATWPAIAIVLVFSPILIASVSGHEMDTTFDYGLIRCLYGFTAGVLAFRVYDLWMRERRASVDRVTATLAEAASLVIVVAFVFIAGKTVISVLAPYVFLTTVIVFSIEGGFISDAIKSRPLEVIGTLSYSIYMVHLFVQLRLLDIGQILERRLDTSVLTYVDLEHKKLLGTQLWHGDLLHIAMLPVVIAVSYVTYRLIEEPSRAWSKSVSERLFDDRGSQPMRMAPNASV